MTKNIPTIPITDIDKMMLDGSFRRLAAEMAKRNLVAQVTNGECTWVPFEKSKFRSRVMKDSKGALRQSINIKKPRVYTDIQGTYPDGTKAPIEEVMREGLPAIKKRTPDERVRSILDRIVGDVQKYGTVPGYSDQRIKEITGIIHDTGRTEVTVEMVRRLIADSLRRAENEYGKTYRPDIKKA